MQRYIESATFDESGDMVLCDRRPPSFALYTSKGITGSNKHCARWARSQKLLRCRSRFRISSEPNKAFVFSAI